MSEPRLLWQPPDERIRGSRMFAFMTRCAGKYGFEPTYAGLHRWSVERRDQFWQEMFDFAGIQPFAPATAVCSGEGMLGTRWFPGMELNFAAHLLDFGMAAQRRGHATQNGHSNQRGDVTQSDAARPPSAGDNAIAIEAEDERGNARRVTRDELRRDVATLQAALREMGVRRGDRVAGYMPNISETVVAMLAAASLGAIWSSCSPDFGVDAVVDRFGQIEPRVLFAVDGYTYNGKSVDCREKIRGIVDRIASIAHVVVVPFLMERPDLSAIPNAAAWGDVLERGGSPRRPTPDTRHPTPADSPLATRHSPLFFEPVPFDHPLYIMYSSGTTGVPKCIVHGHGGTLLQHMKELMLHSDLRPDDTLFYFTTCGWMMWNWLVSGLGVGAAIALYEGSPSHPDLHHVWRFAERVGITHFGTSPRFVAACEKSGIEPGREHGLSKLRCVLSTGSPLTPDQFAWVYDHVKRDVQLASISGGTDIISCFMLGNPLLPVYAGEIQSVGLGMDVHALDDDARPVIGEKGELVCCSPFPSQPVGFWNDSDGRKYRAAYFEHYRERHEGTPARSASEDANPQVSGLRTQHSGLIWRHGDFVEITPRGGVIVYGRSDATLNPGGVRIGTAEIYREIESVPEIVDSVVVGRNTPDADVEVCLFVVLRDGLTLDDGLTARIRRRIAEGASKRHVPRHIRQVTAIPYTRSGKKVEIAVARMLHGQPVPNRDALANPESLEQYAGIV